MVLVFPLLFTFCLCPYVKSTRLRLIFRLFLLHQFCKLLVVFEYDSHKDGMYYDRFACIAAGRIMQFNTIIHLIKRLPVLLIQIGSKLLPLCSFNFRCYPKRRDCSTHSREFFMVEFKEGITIRSGGRIEETTELRKV